MKASSPRTLYIYNKYYQGNPAFGPTSSWENIWKSFLQRCAGGDLHIFNPDEYGIDTSERSDENLIQVILSEDIEMIVMIYHIGMHWKRDFISETTLSWINNNGIRTIAIWGDIQIPNQQKLVKRISKYVSLNLMTASHAAFSRFNPDIPRFYSWVPLEKTATLESKCDCGRNVSFAGSLKNNRLSTVKSLQKAGVAIHVGGGEGLGTLSREEYLKLIDHPISISFAGSRVEPLVNARTFEILSQGSMLLEQWGRETVKFLRPNVDYVPWFNKKDLLEKCEYYSRNPSEAKKIAESGKKRFLDLSDELLWAVIRHESVDAEGIFVRENYFSNTGFSFSRTFLWRCADLIATSRYLSFIFKYHYQVRMRISFFRNVLRILRSKITPTINRS